MGFYAKLVFLLSTASVLVAQAPGGEYWQQYVEYDLDVYLDEPNKTLHGSGELIYVNRSPQVLNQVLMHLYQNAFNSGTLADEVLKPYGREFSPQKSWTGIQIEKLQQDSIALQYRVRDDTILDIDLQQPLQPNDTLHLSLSWTQLVPEHYDRSGYQDRQFDFSQWYPKFVVFDENGWHDDPFGDWGEFYGEIGKYTVRVDVPADQVIASTGVVIQGDPGWAEVTVDTSLNWEDWLEGFSRQREQELTLLDSAARRRVTFLAENVHDFAWMCSPDFVYEHGSWNGIDIHVLFNTQVGASWSRDVVRHGISALAWLSKFGDYAWPQMTITHALLGGGMEYPMLIMDQTDSESLIVHEIGHNWFYAMLGNDELDDAWLDEGFTTFQTNWYFEKNYPDLSYGLTRGYLTQYEFDNLPQQPYREGDIKPVVRYMQSPRNEEIAKHSFDFKHRGSYRLNVYNKASMMLESLRSYLGEERFLAGMRLYFDRWALKHVNEDRFIRAMEEGSGEELDWFFDPWLHTTDVVDYAISHWRVEPSGEGFITTIDLENKGGMAVPLEITLIGAAGERLSAALPNFKHRVHPQLSLKSTFKPLRVILDEEDVFLDVDRRDNDTRKHRFLRYNYPGWDEYPSTGNIYLWEPRMGYHVSEGVDIGLSVDQAYRYPGDYSMLALDYHTTTSRLDLNLEFRHTAKGLPFEGLWSGHVGTWQGLNSADLGFRFRWARKMWAVPIHQLQLSLEHLDTEDLSASNLQSGRFSLIIIDYQNTWKILGWDSHFNVKMQHGPEALGTIGADFSKLEISQKISQTLGFFKLSSRTTLISNSSTTPDIFRSRLATRNFAVIHRSCMASTLHHLGSEDTWGDRYYLGGGLGLRAYTDSLNKGVQQGWSEALELHVEGMRKAYGRVNLHTFLDIGQTSPDGKSWKWFGDMGLGFEIRPTWKRKNLLTTLIRPFTIRFDFPFARIEANKLVATHGHDLWLFTVNS